MEFVKFVIFLVLIVALVVGSAVAITSLIGKATCDDFANQNPQYQFKYTFWNGCLVKLPNGVWLSATKMNWVNGEIKIGP